MIKVANNVSVIAFFILAMMVSKGYDKDEFFAKSCGVRGVQNG